MSLSVGQTVKWSWGEGTARGEIKQIYTQSTSKRFKGTTVTRNATPEDPAYLIEQKDGDRVLKSRSEISAA